MKFYTVSKAELEKVGETSFDITLYFSVASFFLSQALDLSKMIVFSTPPTPEGAAFAAWVRIISLILAVVFFSGAFIKLYRKGSYFRLIREEHGEEVRIWSFGKKTAPKEEQEE